MIVVHYTIDISIIIHFTDCTYDFATAINSKTICSATAFVTFLNSCFKRHTSYSYVITSYCLHTGFFRILVTLFNNLELSVLFED